MTTLSPAKRVSTTAVITTNRAGQGMAEINRTRLALQTERVKSGAIKGWSWGHLSFPSGQSLPWNATITTVHKDLASAVQGAGPGGGGGGGAGGAAAAFAKHFPNRSYVAHVDALREAETTVRVDLYRVVAVARR